MAAIAPRAVRSELVAHFRAAADPARAKREEWSLAAGRRAAMITSSSWWDRVGSRQQARFNEAEVLAFVREHKAVLSGLTKREALKHYPRKVLAELR